MPISKAILLLSLVSSLVSCAGQKQESPESRSSAQSALASTSRQLGDTVSAPGTNIDCILQDRYGNYWFASNSDGAYRYDGKTLVRFMEKDGLCSNFVLGIQEDIHGNLWFSTRDGVCRFDGTSFVNYTDTIKHAWKGTPRIQPGGLFFPHLNGVCYYDGNTFTNFTIHPDSYSPPANSMYRPYGVYCTLVDRTGNIWLGTQEKGVCRFDGSSFTYLTEKDLAGPAVRRIFEDKAGNLWFGNNGGGLFRYDGKSLSNITEEKKLGNPEFLRGKKLIDKAGSLARVFSLSDDRDGNLWIGTIDAGLWKYDGVHLTNYTTKEGLPGNSVWYLYRDRKGDLWIVTNGTTISRLEGMKFRRVEFR
jgi:ligand-binding sensor domain-containing protein